MAGDWIKLEHVTPDKPEIFAMAEALGIDPDAVLGKLARVWIWADQHTISGTDLRVSEAFLDRLTHQPGFAIALRKVDWLQARSGSLAIPRFDRHNGQSAKARAASNRRVAEHRDVKRDCNGETVTDALPKQLPEKRREEKRREDEKRLNDEHAQEPAAPDSTGVHRSSLNRSQESALMERLAEFLGKDEMARAGGHWRVNHVRKHPGLLERALADLEHRVKTGEQAKTTRGAWLEDLVKRWNVKLTHGGGDKRGT